ncbi:YtxH domain-containing protein [Paenibacillus xylaniclasticus]|uniref:YtxH domain-containing protein n=1 Tax=Paenibacillus xylaniclasticus TaxID=588083 RepID=UPI000FDC34F4|nr:MULTISPECIES: YtxH domain-containing protein [Paenibacillus]GFN30201.1 hypothetical protein PCURB6_04610 [Paenibacillus curdlanolyticus]
MAKSTSTKGFLLGALAGAVVGSITALLFAPKSGKELRSDIADSAQKVSDTTVRLAKQVGDGASDAAERAKQAASNVITNIKSWRGGSDVKEELEEAIVSTLTAGIESSEQEADSVTALSELEPETEQIEEAQTSSSALQPIGY